MTSAPVVAEAEPGGSGSIPPAVWVLAGGLAALALSAGAGWWLMAGADARAKRQQPVALSRGGVQGGAPGDCPPAHATGVSSSLATRPAQSSAPGAARPFHDLFMLPDGGLAMVLGELGPGGPDALGLATTVGDALRSCLQAGLAPRVALRRAGSALERELAGHRASVVVATCHGDDGRLVYALAGGPPPIVVGCSQFEPVLACAAPALGAGGLTSLRQTTLRLGPGATACFFTPAVIEASVTGAPLGYRRLALALGDLRGGAGASAAGLLDVVSRACDPGARAMVACTLRVSGRTAALSAADGGRRLEELELVSCAREPAAAEEFLVACGVPSDGIDALSARLGDGHPAPDGSVIEVSVGPGVSRAQVLALSGPRR